MTPFSMLHSDTDKCEGSVCMERFQVVGLQGEEFQSVGALFPIGRSSGQ